MAEADARIESMAQAETDQMDKPMRKWLRLALLLSLPLVLLVGGVVYYLANDHYVSTDNAYVQQEKVSVASEIGGRIVEVAVSENQHVVAGDLLFRIDPEPFRIAVAQADASIAAAQVKVVTMQTFVTSPSRAMASVVVPMLMISEQSSGTSRATARAMRS
jgi:membrane fusion protein (multidrug efflux system)